MMTDRTAALAAELAELVGDGGFNPLRLALHGQNAPLAAQYVHDLLRSLPREVAAHPGRPEFRAAMRALWRTRDVYLEATEADIRAGLRFLAARNLLPRWVVMTASESCSEGVTLAAQYVHDLLRSLPRDLTRHSGSREFRAAMRALWRTRDVYLEATRADVRAGLDSLAARGLAEGRAR